MDFKNISTNRRGAASESGFALSEMMVAVGITALLLLAVASVSLFSSRSFASLANYVDLDARNAVAMDQITRDLREANAVTDATATTLTLQAGDGSSVRYAYSPTDKTLIRTQNTVTRTILDECDRFTFSLGQRNPVGGSYDVYPAATPATAKVVNVAWTCSRKIMGLKQNTESVQTARIVIRKQGS